MKKGSMLGAAIAVGFVLGDTLSQRYDTLDAFLYKGLIFVCIVFMYMIFYVANELHFLVTGIESEKEGEKNRRHIIYHDCKKERKIKELEKQRNEFFDAYFKQSSIQMKTRK